MAINQYGEKIIAEPELLWALYWGNCYIQQEIANLFECAKTTISHWMKEYDIPISL